MKNIFIFALVFTGMIVSAQEIAQDIYHGPRAGFVFVIDKHDPGRQLSYDTFEGRTENFDAFTTICGYHVDYEFQSDSELNPVIQVDALLMGLEQGIILPSLTTAAGVRHENGFEAGLGPNTTFDSTSFVYAIGFNLQAGSVIYPMNLAMGISEDTVRFSFLTGFNFVR